MIYFTAHTFKCVCHCRRAMFRVLGMYNFGLGQKSLQKKVHFLGYLKTPKFLSEINWHLNMHAQMKVKDHEKSKLIKLNMTFSVTRQLYLVTYLTKSCVCSVYFNDRFRKSVHYYEKRWIEPRTTDAQWRHKSKKSENLGWCGRQNMLRPYQKIWE